MNIKIKKIFINNFFLITLAVSVIGVIFSSYNRFIIHHDYIVGYEGTCDPEIYKCFVGIDDSSGEEYYYTKMKKYEPDLYLECGVDITDCENANMCLDYDRECTITYCDEKTKTEDEVCFSNVIHENDNQIINDEILQNNLNNNK